MKDKQLRDTVGDRGVYSIGDGLWSCRSLPNMETQLQDIRDFIGLEYVDVEQKKSPVLKKKKK